ncbi:hypothetical protein TRIUR3_30325 [Triticum urartu]|uniref:Uncharacterized protein n=1 Tax=Triticum urartu TaxID=4572 RepID=M7ZLJ2_TRIUA|nr:hypothetical protein TRIUR3_30325 [Triticum urartu]
MAFNPASSRGISLPSTRSGDAGHRDPLLCHHLLAAGIPRPLCYFVLDVKATKFDYGDSPTLGLLPESRPPSRLLALPPSSSTPFLCPAAAASASPDLHLLRLEQQQPTPAPMAFDPASSRGISLPSARSGDADHRDPLLYHRLLAVGIPRPLCYFVLDVKATKFDYGDSPFGP